MMVIHTYVNGKFDNVLIPEAISHKTATSYQIIDMSDFDQGSFSFCVDINVLTFLFEVKVTLSS